MSSRNEFSAGLGAKTCGAFADAGWSPAELNRFAEDSKLLERESWTLSVVKQR
ncbi:MAG: hypothetical protein WAV11_01100 [Minisyncoccia bacterium]